jgi:heterodisulfide reductase subunit A
MAAALSLADSSSQVYLVEREASIGGWAASFCCKATNVCTKCSACVVPKKLSDVAVHPRITILTSSTVAGISGEVGNFKVEVIQKPQYVSPERCIACGICAETCPTEPKAIRSPSPEAVPYSYVLDASRCLRFKGETCDLCRAICPTNAIDFDHEPEKKELSVSAIIVATGFDVFDARQIGCLGYGRYPNVLTGLDLDKAFNREGCLKLPSNGKEPKKVAFIQCIGSRDETHGYCSQVCCKYAMRFGQLIKYQNPKAEVTIFYIDLQTAGKGFARFYEECQETIRFVRGVPVEISETSSGELEVRFENISEGKVARETFDLVALSVGLSPREDSWDVARALGINLGESGFFDTKAPLNSNETNVEGIFLAGTCQGPRDIPESFAHGMAAAQRATEVLQRWS